MHGQWTCGKQNSDISLANVHVNFLLVFEQVSENHSYVESNFSCKLHLLAILKYTTTFCYKVQKLEKIQNSHEHVNMSCKTMLQN